MELRHLRYFVAVAEEENVTRAAGRLHVSQPALSKQIRDLEDEIGFELLERSAKSVRLSEAGRTFLVEARAVLQRAEEAVRTAKAVATGHSGELNIGYAPMPTVQFLPSALQLFRSQLPGVRVRLHDLSTGEILEGLRRERLQIAFLVQPTPAMLRGLEFEPLCRDHMRLAMSRQHPWAQLRSVPLSQVARAPLVSYHRKEYPEYHDYLKALFAGSPRIVEEYDGGGSVITAVEAGAGLAILPASVEFVTGARIRLVPIVPAPPPLILGAAWTRGRLCPIAEKLLAIARGTAQRV